MIPNIIAMFINRNSFQNLYHNKIAEIFEQIGRYCCFILMIFNIPYTWFGFYFTHGLTVYIIVNSIFIFTYCLEKKWDCKSNIVVSYSFSSFYFFWNYFSIYPSDCVFNHFFSNSHIDFS